jgi:hypothetical protein
MLEGLDAEYAHWATPEKASAWVRQLRERDERRTQKKFRSP